MLARKNSVILNIYLFFLNFSRFLLLPINQKHRKIIRISMKRSTTLSSIQNISLLIQKYSQKNRVSIEFLFDEFKTEIFQFEKIGMFIFDKNSKKNLLYAHAYYDVHKGFNDHFLDNIFRGIRSTNRSIFDHQSPRLGNYERANVFLNPLHVDSWTRYNHQKLKTRVAVEVLGNLTYESLFQKRDVLLSSNSPPHHVHLTADGSTDLFVIGKLEGDIPVFYNEVLVSFSYHNAKGELIDSFHNEPKNGVSKSKTLGYYSYLRNNEDGFFFLITALPEGCKFVHLEFTIGGRPIDSFNNMLCSRLFQ